MKLTDDASPTKSIITITKAHNTGFSGHLLIHNKVHCHCLGYDQ